MWFKVDDSMALHPKVVAAGNSAIGLWVRAGAWSSAQLTNGHIPSRVVTSLGGNKRVIDDLVKAGLWNVEPDGYQFHDWPDYQPSADDVHRLKGRRQNGHSTGGTLGNHRRWHVRRGINDPTCEHCQEEQ